MEHIFHRIVIFVLCIAASECTQGLYPNVPLQNPTETPEFTQPGILFVYNWPVDDQALCPGTVTALDYCYQTSIRSSGQDNRTIFTLLLLNSSYRIIQTINVSNLTSPDNCGNRGGITTCCNRQQLRPEQLFQVPDSPVAGFGIFSRTGVDTILAFRGSSSIVGTVTGFQLTASAVIVNNRISVRQNGISIQYRMLNFVIDSSFITPDSTAGTDSVAESASSTELTTKIPDDSDTGYPPDVTSEPPPAMPHPPTRVSIILIIAIVIGCIVATLFTATVAMWTYLCFRARAIHQRKSTKMGVNVVTAERNSEQIYETIPEDINGPTVPPNYTLWVQRSRDKQQGQWVFTPTNIGNNNTEVSEFVQNPAYRSLNNLPRTCQLQTAINMDENPSYCSSQERLFSN